jgi:hypothetical protein
MRVKIKRKNKLKGNNEFSFWDLNWKGIKTLTKEKKSKEQGLRKTIHN